jgi:tetratricopeptide (TPR) repeat protein
MRASADGERELADDRLAFGCLEQCTRMAREVVSSASSVIGETARPMRPGVRELPGLHELPGGSDYGGFSNTRAWIEGWISGPAQEDVAEESILSSEGRASTSQSFTSSRDVMSDTTWTTRSNSQNQHGNNPDPSYSQDVELFLVYVRTADEYYKSKTYDKAESYYRRVLETSEKLQIAVDRNDIFIKIGMACFEQQKWDEARFSFSMATGRSRWLAERFIEDGNRKSAMYDIAGASACFEGALATLTLTELPSQVRREIHTKAGTACFKLGKKTEAKTHFSEAADVKGGMPDPRCFEAEHYLAMIHFQKSELDIALRHCKVASSGRMRILGKEHASWHESIALLSAIYEEKSLLSAIDEEKRHSIEAESYAKLLPEGYKRVRALVTQG